MIKSGIYSIRNVLNGRLYVGSATNIQSRWRSHRSSLENNAHHSATLQRSWNKYGKELFEFSVLEHVENLDDLISREQFWIDVTKSADYKHGFNICAIAGSRRGSKASLETKNKMSEIMKNRPPELIARIAASRIGKKHSQETLSKMRGQKREKETCEKISSALKGVKKSPEHRRNLAAANMGKSRGPQSSDVIAKRVAATRATKIARGLIAPCQ